MRARFVAAVMGAVSVLAVALTGAAQADGAKRTYYYASQLQGHPYLLDSLLGMKYAAKTFNVTVVPVGPQGWDPVAGAQAVEQAVAKHPDGIITTLWEPGGIPAIKRAMAQGIPVIVIEANLPDSGALTFIGLDNYQAGVDTAKELIRVGGKTGKFVASGNWGASNTDAKFKGLMDYLKDNSQWELLGRVDDKATTETAIDAAKSMYSAYPNLTGIVGLDSSSGSGICLAAEELNKDISSLAVVVNDREQGVLDCIKDGSIKSTVINKTALEAYMAVQMLEAYNDGKVGLANVPISSDNKAAHVTPFPQFMYMGTEVINKDNLKYFTPDAMPKLD